jgi:hypothetical protein
MATGTVQVIGPPTKWIGRLLPGQSIPMSTSILVQLLPDTANMILTPCARHLAHAPGGIPTVYAVGIEDVSVVTNTAAPSGYNLNFRMVNRHSTQALTTVMISYSVIT